MSAKENMGVGHKASLIDLDTLRQRMKEEFPETVIAVVHFNSSLDDWKVSLRPVIERIIRSIPIA